MASKRSASSDLNHDNWNQEEEPEEAGTFLKASDEVLEKRVVKAARRRLVSNTGENTKNAFGSFTGFKTVPTTSSPFSFLSKSKTDSATIPIDTVTNIPSKTSNGPSKIPENGISSGTASTVNVPKDVTKNTDELQKTSTSPKKASVYYAKLKGLNESVAQWIKTHVDANPVCILTPIFKDYEKYLKEIELQHKEEQQPQPSKEESTKLLATPSKPTTVKTDVVDKVTSEQKSENFVFAKTALKTPTDETESGKTEKSVFDNPSPTYTSIFGSSNKTTEGKSLFGNIGTAENNPFLSKSPTSIETKPESKPLTDPETKVETEVSKSEEKPTVSLSFFQGTTTPATFSFGQNTTSTTASAGFSFGSAKPFSFGVQAVKPADTDKAENEEKQDEDDEPPKPDFKPVVEEGSIYEQRCKVFVKKEGNFGDRGVGTLFLKPAPNDKMQLIVRAVNSLGNVILNTLLTESIPIKRMNRNTIMLVCIPLPDNPPPPTSVLLRVKTDEDADKLLEALNKHKK